jgi:AcrR family transcriptional regulator
VTKDVLPARKPFRPHKMMSDLRQQILSTAKTLLIKHGYHGLSMRQIAEAVGVSKAALYYHFKDKEELLLAILVDYLEEIEAVIDEAQAEGGDSRQQVFLLIKGVLSQPVEQRALIRLSSQEMAQLSVPARAAFNRAYHEKFIDKIRGLLSAGMDKGELRSIDPDVATWTLLGMMYPYFYPVHTADVPPPSGVTEQLASIYLDGMASG